MSAKKPALCLLAVALAACGKPAPSASEAPAVMPADPKLARLYAQTCKTCHGLPASGAPQAGDLAAWQPRVAQGMNVLIDHTLTGFKGMPPLGACSDCTEQDFDALIKFMSGQAS